MTELRKMGWSVACAIMLISLAIVIARMLEGIFTANVITAAIFSVVSVMVAFGFFVCLSNLLKGR